MDAAIRTGPFWDELDSSFPNDEDIASDLHQLLLSIQGECEAVRSTSAFRSTYSSSEGNPSTDNDNDTPRDTRAAQISADAAGDSNRPDYVSLLHSIEGSCRSLQASSPGAKSIPDDSETSSDCSKENELPLNCGDGDHIGSLVAVRCALRSTQRRVASQKRSMQKKRQLSKSRQGQGGMKCDAEILRLIPPELHSKVSCPVEV
uniref:Uncharacterized protein n=1 Tax=Pseudictyota dubia TaxID=2749911 RepID=A0A7R9Z9D1_9STRA|mmetsp:Transcript_28183/g.52464  ORF Transcript_28183/g.52464 Transcript_28183/m.52464 type:complete len:204 (+) Transcript_28183:195-806(+)